MSLAGQMRLSIAPADSLRREDRLRHPRTGESLTVAAKFRLEGDRLLLACAGEDGALRRVVVDSWEVLETILPS